MGERDGNRRAGREIHRRSENGAEQQELTETAVLHDLAMFFKPRKVVPLEPVTEAIRFIRMLEVLLAAMRGPPARIVECARASGKRTSDLRD